MGMYCACDVKMTGDDWECKCDQEGWNRTDDGFPKKDGIYTVRMSSDGGDRHESDIEFSLEKKFTYQAGWSDTVPDEWDTPQSDDIVYQWKEKE